jgi:hypothetical protein
MISRTANAKFVNFKEKTLFEYKNSEYKNDYSSEELTIKMGPNWFEKLSDLEIQKRVMKEIKYCSQNVLKISDSCKEMYCKTN